jgi:hypothetical protein
VLALTLTVAVHVIGAAALLGALVMGSERSSSDGASDGGDGGGGHPPVDPPRRPAPGGLPLDDAAPGGWRLRGAPEPPARPPRRREREHPAVAPGRRAAR